MQEQHTDMRKPLPISSMDVARRAGVSQSTVSKVANNSASLTTETRMRVISAARELGYALTPRKSGYRVAVIVPEQRFVGYIADMLSGLSQEILDRGMSMEIITDRRLSLLNERCVEGAIGLTWMDHFYAEWAKTMIIPLVRINGQSNHLKNCWSVYPNGIHSLQVLVDRLWNLGHRKIAFFFFNSKEHEIKNVARRLDGFLLAMQSHGVEDAEQYCLFNCLQREGEVLSEQLIAWHREGVTAVIFSNGLGTGKMMQCLQLSGLKVPQDISIVGWEQQYFSAYTIPALSTLYPDPKLFAKAAVTLLIKMIEHHRNLRDVLLPYRWIERDSIGYAPGCQRAEADALERADSADR